MHRQFLLLSSLAAFLAVALGAFGAHALRGRLDDYALAIYQTGVQYQFWHALGLGLIAFAAQSKPDAALLRWAGWLMLAGIALFSGSLYVLALSGLRWLGMITPFGGTAFLGAWLLLAVHAWRCSPSSKP
ncbi:DUF423 domain-containing protein [Methylococcus sp. EFPC2]|uniref:DUF423 domain-containing protein n=1 Tax=Methylococcus sp. EFPC2 TaxID=2812648 RepID=UPI001967351C|nr:DUF423 domain-containing protein [Methylococcus sp. EFPC2]QSA96204.1 DUF423 domain-containing protein [Methylococcus sp. EFPC2]